jgi:acyl-CoA reductase-like NAD-dependent aldehyde dehydrogenase
MIENADKLFIAGEWVDPSTDAQIELINHATGEIGGHVAEAVEADVARAVDAAYRAFQVGACRPARGVSLHQSGAKALTAFADAAPQRQAGSDWNLHHSPNAN